MPSSRDHIEGFPNQVTTVRALYDFLSTRTGELQFHKGDIISVVKYTHKEWWEGSLRGRIGLFPSTPRTKARSGGLTIKLKLPVAVLEETEGAAFSDEALKVP